MKIKRDEKENSSRGSSFENESVPPQGWKEAGDVPAFQESDSQHEENLFSFEELEQTGNIVPLQSFVERKQQREAVPGLEQYSVTQEPQKPQTRKQRTRVKKGRTELVEGLPVSKYGIFCGERGILDTRNTLNDLTGREWLFFQNSMIITGYSTTAKENVGYELRKIHPSPKPPHLMQEIISFFTKNGGIILDPFAGVGGTLLGATLCPQARRAVGIELSTEYTEAYKNVCDRYHIPRQTMICDDARNMLNHPEVAETLFDLVLTDPPYSDLLNREQNGQKKKLYGSNAPTPFSNSPLDIGNLTRADFLKALTEIIALSAQRLKPGKYLVVFCKDLQPHRETRQLNFLHTEVAEALNSISSICFVGMKIWHDQATSLYPFGYPYQLILNQMHQYILIFQKVH